MYDDETLLLYTVHNMILFQFVGPYKIVDFSMFFVAEKHDVIGNCTMDITVIRF